VGNKAKITFLFKQPGDVNITFANIKKARKMLGFKPKYNIKEGMKKYIEWYLEHD
jgi:nucleoside-diphosphate-sugar epimerase